MISVDEAQERVLRAVSPVEQEEIPVPQAVGRVLEGEVIAVRPLPPWDNSSMDGYAVRSADCAAPGARLAVCGVIAAGHPSTQPVGPGEALRIMTGAPMPEGADAVVMREETEARDGYVLVQPAVKAGALVRRRGDDVRAGDRVLEAGGEIGVGELGLLVALGVERVRVFRRPRVSIVSTGDELVELGQTPGPGQMFESNSLVLAAMVRAAGGEPLSHPLTRDDPELLRARFVEALQADMMLSIGGVSVGDFDFVKEALEAAGLRMDFWKVAVQPGKPLAFGMAGRCIGFGLPGNPASAMVSFELFVRPALRKLAGLRERQRLFRPRAIVTLEEGLRKESGRRAFLRAHVRREGDAILARANVRQGSGMLRSMVGINALLEIAEDRGAAEAGERVPALLLEAI